MSGGQDASYLETITCKGATVFFDSRGTLEYACRLGFDRSTGFEIEEVYDEGITTVLSKLNEALLSGQVRCSQRGTIFDVYLKILPSNHVIPSSKQKLVGSVHGRLFRYLTEEMHLQLPLRLQLTIKFEEPLNKIVVTKKMPFMSDPRDKVWPKAFRFEMEVEGDPWTIPSTEASVKYTLDAEIIVVPFIKSSGGLGIVPQKGDGETAMMAKKFLEKRAHCDFTLVSGNGENRVQCHKVFLDGSSLFFDRLLKTNMKEGKLKECQLEGSTKEGLEALLKFLYYRSVEDAVGSCGLAYELLHLGHMYDIPRLEGTMRGLLLTKLDDWWDLEVAMNLFLRTRLLEDDDEWQPLKDKSKEVLKMKSAEWTSNSNTLLDDLMTKDANAAKELVRLLSTQDGLD